MARTAVLAALYVLPLAGQPSVDRIVEQIEKYASLEDRNLALETRLSAAGRLRVIAPAGARRLLEGGLPALQADAEEGQDYLTYKLLKDYAAIDLDAAERALPSIKDRIWGYTALIDQATTQRDFPRAIKLMRGALREGHYSLGAITHLLSVLATNDASRVAPMQDELMRAFPVRKASLVDVKLLLTYVVQAPAIDPKRGRRAARLAFLALDRLHINHGSARGEQDTATFSLGNRKIETKTTYDTVLLPAGAFLAVFDPEEYRKRRQSLPEWRDSLAGLSAADLPGLMRAPHVLRAAPAPRRNDLPAPPPRPYLQMSYDELLAYAEKVPPDYRGPALLTAGRHAGVTDEQRERALRLALECISGLRSAGSRYHLMEGVFQEILERRLDALMPAALDEWIRALDEASRSNDRMLLTEHYSGGFSRRYAALADILDKRGIALSAPNPAIEAQRAIRDIERLRLPAQDFALETQDGKMVRLSELRGRVVVLDFWATWCEPCRKALPEVARLDREWSGKGVVVLGVDNEAPGVVREFAAKNGITYPTLIDHGRKVHDLFGVEGIPATVVIGRDGTLIERVPFPHDQQNFRTALRKAGVE